MSGTGSSAGFAICPRGMRGIAENVVKTSSRGWFLVKFGTKTAILRDDPVIFNFMDLMQRLFVENGLQVAPAPTWNNIISDDQHEILEQVALYADQVISDPPLQLPIMLFIEDSVRSELYGVLQHHFQAYMYMFLFRGSELEGMIRSDNMSDARDWTNDFAKFVLEREKPLPIVLDDEWERKRRLRLEMEDRERQYQEGIELEKERLYEEERLRLKELQAKKLEEEKIRQTHTELEEENERRRQTQKLLQTRRDAEEKRKIMQKQSLHSESSSSSNALRYLLPSTKHVKSVQESLHEVEEIYSSSDGDEEVEHLSSEESMPTSTVCPPKAEYDEQETRTVEVSDLEYAEHELSKGDIEHNTMAPCVYCPSLLLRFDNPFTDFCHNLRLIEVCILCSMSKVPEESIQSHIRMIFDEMFDRGFVDHILAIELSPRIDRYPMIDCDVQFLAEAVRTVLRLYERLTRLQIFTEQTKCGWSKMEKLFSDMPPAISSAMNRRQTINYLHIIRSGHSPTSELEQDNQWNKDEEEQKRIENYFPNQEVIQQGSLENSCQGTPLVNREQGHTYVEQQSYQENNSHHDNVLNESPHHNNDNSWVLDDQNDDGWGNKFAESNEDNWPARRMPIQAVQANREISIINQRPYWMDSEKKAPPCDFRTLPSSPIIHDIISNEQPYIRRAITNGFYEDSQHFLDVVFRLFREDLVSPLRDGIAQWRSQNYPAPETQKDLLIVENVRIKGVQARRTDGTQMRYVQLPACTNLKIGESRKLCYGSMIAMSGDQFQQHFLLGIIVEKNEEVWKSRSMIGVSFLDDNESDSIDLDVAYHLVEGSAFLEAYQHVLNVIKNINPYLPIPFERYTVTGKKDVLKPAYMRTHTDKDIADEEAKLKTEYEMKRFADQARLQTEDLMKREQRRRTPVEDPIEKTWLRGLKRMSQSHDEFFDDDEKTRLLRRQIIEAENYRERPKAPNVESLKHIRIRGDLYAVDDLASGLDAERMGLDESQKDALLSALTHELSIIQGPPGTGKTFLGSEIVRTILANRERWRNHEPILVVCYTNQALDQFMEKLHRSIMEDIAAGLIRRTSDAGPIAVRLGSRSESEYLKKHIVLKKEAMDAHRELADQERMKGPSARELYNQKRKAEENLAKMVCILRNADKRLISADHIMPVLKITYPDHYKQLAFMLMGDTDSHGHSLNSDEVMSCWLLDQKFNNDVNRMDESKRREHMNSKQTGNNSDFEDENPEDECESVGLSLAEQLAQLNLKLQEDGRLFEDLTDECHEKYYESIDNWDMVEMNYEKHVIMFGITEKRDVNPHFKNSRIRTDEAIMQALAEAETNILKAIPLTKNEAAEVRDIWKIPKQRRWMLYNLWKRMVKFSARLEIPKAMFTYKISCEEIQIFRKEKDAVILKQCLIIGATTTGAAKNRDLLEKLNCRTLIVEEAAEVLEAHILASVLPTIEHAIFIGDHQQLRPNPAVYTLAREYNLEVSLFERLVKNEFPHSTLQLQHRMLPKLTETIVRPLFYPSLKDASSVLRYPNIGGMSRNLFFWAHKCPEETMSLDTASKKNKGEIQMTVELVDYILKNQDYAMKDITVLTTYAAQTSEMRSAIGARFGTDNGITSVPVETVDGYQGKENKVIILSLVRSYPSDTVGFLGIPNRICVAWTRAQHGLFILGNLEFLSTYSFIWQQIRDSLVNANSVSYHLPVKCKVHGTEQRIENPFEFRTKCPEGGCQMQCLSKYPYCNHLCQRLCHPDDENHLSVTCHQPCEKMMVCNEHKCTKKCSEACGTCKTMVLKKGDYCEHEFAVPCHMKREANCHERCNRLLKCGHQCVLKCSQECDNNCNQDVKRIYDNCRHEIFVKCSDRYKPLPPCGASCRETLACGHPCREPCSADECTFLCMELSNRILPCGHNQDVPCHESVADAKCNTEVLVIVNGCGHSAKFPCHANRDQKYCPRACGKLLSCGTPDKPHVCSQKCGDCFKAGAHECSNTCSKMRDCGHGCINRCNVDCGECRSLCLLECDHQQCGRSAKMSKNFPGYARTCNKLCALCSKLCDNACEHRMCNKRCFEECDVKACEEKCKKILQCGHACLGFCSEKCPDLCGICDSSVYSRVMSELPENERNKIQRLVQLYPCGHVFTAKLLDAKMLEWKECGSQGCATCPTCARVITKSRRYARMLKKAAFNKEMKKILNIATHSAIPPISILRQKMQDVHKETKVYKAKGPQKNSNHITFVKFGGKILQEINEEKDITRSIFWKDILDVYVCMAEMFEIISQMGHGRSIFYCGRLQNLNSLLNDITLVPKCGRDSEFMSKDILMNRLITLSVFIQSRVSHRLSGVIMPHALYELHRIAYLISVANFASIAKTFTTDITVDQQVYRDDVLSLGRQVLVAGPSDEYRNRYGRFITSLKNMVDGCFTEIKMFNASGMRCNIPDF